jgi:hypothetical protein
MAEELVLKVDSNVGEVTADVEKLDDATKKAKGGFAGIGTAVKGVGAAIKAAGIGIVVGLLAKMMDVFRQNQSVVDTFNTAMEAMSIAFNDLFKFISNNVGTVTGYFKSLFEDPKQTLIDFGTAIKDNIIERFQSLLDTFGHLGQALKHLFEGEYQDAWESVKAAGKESVDIITGVDNSVDKITETVTNAAGVIKNYATETWNSAAATVELQKAAELAGVQIQGLIEEYDRQAEKLRQVRDDETRTFAERIAANEELGRTLQKQGEEMQKLADIQVAAAQVEYEKNASQENLLALTTALNEQKAIEAQITGFQSEQLTNQVALEKELGEVKNELLLEGLEGMERELAELEQNYERKIEMARKAGVDTAAITEQYEKAKSDIVKSYQEEVVKWSEMSSQQQLGIASQTAHNMVAILGEETAAGKAMAIVATTIDTYKSAQAAYASLAGIPFVGPALGAVAAGAAIAMGIRNIAAIRSSKPDSVPPPPSTSGGGGGGGGGGNLNAGVPAPEMLSGSFDLGGGMTPEPMQAYVVSDDITQNQNANAAIRRRATI